MHYARYVSENFIKAIMIFPFRSGIYFLISLLLFSCNESVTYKPSSAGKMDEVLWVLADGDLWIDTLGKAIEHTYHKTFEVLPQPEPEFLLRQSTFKKFSESEISKKYRNIVFSVSKDTPSELLSFIKSQLETKGLLGKLHDNPYAVFTLKDVWASPQNVIFIVADTKESLYKNIVSQDKRVKNIILKMENEHLKKYIFKLGENKELSSKVKEKFGFDLKFPKEYYLSYETEDFFWIRKETPDLSSNIMLYKIPLDSNPDKIDWKKYALDIRLHLGKSYISSEAPNTYMILEDVHAPVIQNYTETDEKIMIETRALWKILNDFMGGPFVNYFWLDKASKTVYMLDGFVHAPDKSKKQYIRHLDNIFSPAI